MIRKRRKQRLLFAHALKAWNIRFLLVSSFCKGVTGRKKGNFRGTEKRKIPHRQGKSRGDVGMIDLNITILIRNYYLILFSCFTSVSDILHMILSYVDTKSSFTSLIFFALSAYLYAALIAFWGLKQLK